MWRKLSIPEQFTRLQPWMASIIHAVRKDLKKEHLQKNREFMKRHFPGKTVARLTADDMTPVYGKIVTEEPGVAEFVTNRWLLHNTDVYDHFESQLREISPDFDKIEELEQAVADKLVNSSIELFGPINTCLFCVFNAVAIPKSTESRLFDLAQAAPIVTTEVASGGGDLSREKHDKELRKLADKYEKKLAGMQKKYDNDTAALKKQIGSLQRKLTTGATA